MIRASITHWPGPQLASPGPNAALNGESVTAWTGPGDAIASLGRSRGPAWLGVTRRGTCRNTARPALEVSYFRPGPQFLEEEEGGGEKEEEEEGDGASQFLIFFC